MLNSIIFSIYFYDKITRLQFLLGIIFLFFIFLKKRRIFLKKKFLFLFLIIVIYSLIILTKNSYSYGKMLQQSIVCGVIILSYFNLFKYYSLKKIWNTYMKMGIIFSYLAILQGIVYYLIQVNIFIKPYNIWGLEKSYILAEKLIQVTSIAGEPGMFAQVLLPAVIFTLEKILKRKKIRLNDIVILIAYLWTFTAIAFFSLGVYGIIKFMILLKDKQLKNILIFILILGIGSVLILSKIKTEAIERKIIESFNSILNFDTLNYYKLNLSSFALFSNIKAAINSNNYFLGNGFGSIEEVYYRYFLLKDHTFYGWNATDGYSLLVRIFSEFGIVGIILIVFYVLRNINLNKKEYYMRTINLSALLGIISYFIRGGSYFMQGTIIFFLFLIFTKKPKRR